eukprot:jgi/Picre1/29103/NNA_004496.t1
MQEDGASLCSERALSGLFHASGVLVDATLANQSISGIRKVFAPKVVAMEHLASHLGLHPEGVSVLFSSVASLLGSPGQANYSVANSWLDSKSCEISAMGHSCVSVQWGAWSGSGMAAGDAAIKRAVERQNMKMISPRAGIVALRKAVSSLQDPIKALVPFDLNKMKIQATEGRSVPPVFNALLGPITIKSSASSRIKVDSTKQVKIASSQESMKQIVREILQDVLSAEVGDDDPLMASGLDSLASVEFKNALEAKLAVQLPSTLIFDYPNISSISKFIASSSRQSAAPNALSEDYFVGEIGKCVMEILGADINPSDPLMAAGLDSLGAVELQNSLQRMLNVELPSTFVFDYPTVQAMSAYVAKHVEPTQAASEEEPGFSNTLVRGSNLSRGMNLKVVSMSSKVPGLNPRGLYVAEDAAGIVPLCRWDLSHEELVLGTAPIRFSMFLDNIDAFDSELFSLSKNEASIIDPQHRNLLECAFESLANMDSLSDMVSSGVFVGIASTEYRKVVHDHINGYSPLSATGTLSISVAAGRVSFTFGFQGPAVPVETACSSSLVALHTSANSINLGQCTNALSGGVNMLLTPSTTAMFQKAGMLAPDGRCKTLSSAANGYVRADACGMMFITSMDVQQYSMEICGTAVNQDGRSSSLTAPNGPAQQSVIRAALKQDALSPDDIGIMQMHGTGTPLGDPIEVGAISGVIGQARSMPVSLTASKSWAGHSEAGAGVVGLQHASHMVSESLLIEVLHLRNLNKYLSNAGSCWSAARQKSPSVEEGTSSVAGISAFAFQGTNAHSLVKQGSAIDSPVNPDVPWHHSICWIAGPVHSSLSSASSESDSLRFEAHLLRGKRGAYLMDHKVMNRILVPGAAFMELAAAVGNMGSRDRASAILLQSAIIPSPFQLDAQQPGSDLLSIYLKRTDGAISLGQNGTLCLQGVLGPLVTSPCLDEMHQREDSSTGILMRNDTNNELHSCIGNISNGKFHEASDVNMSPAQIDCCLQLGAIPSSDRGMGMQVPTGVGCFTGRSSVPDQVTGTCLEKSRSRLQSYLDYYIFPGEGNCQSIQDLLAKPLVAPSKSSPKPAIQSVSFKYQIDWLVDQPSPGAHTDQVNDVKVTLKDGLPANLCSTSISVLQQIGSCSLALTTGNALSSGFEICQNRMISVPLLWGLMRSINLEAPSAIDFVL